MVPHSRLLPFLFTSLFLCAACSSILGDFQTGTGPGSDSSSSGSSGSSGGDSAGQGDTVLPEAGDDTSATDGTGGDSGATDSTVGDSVVADSRIMDTGSVFIDVPPGSYTVGGTVKGLAAGESVVLLNTGGVRVTVSADGPFTFPAAVMSGGAYSVTVGTQPTGAIVETCTPSGATGNVGMANVTSVTITCTPTLYTVGGSVSGLQPGATATLKNNGVDDLAVTGTGPWTFKTSVASGQMYAVTVVTSGSPSESCVIAGASGTVGAANVTTVVVTCTVATYAVGGTVAGLTAGHTVTLLNNGADALPLGANGPFGFGTRLAGGQGYNVTVSVQPAGQTCNVSASMGTVGAADVTSVVVNCTSGSYTIGGTLSGLLGGDQMQVVNNGTDSKYLNGNGPFTFTTPIASGAAYNVTVLSQPGTPPQNCTVTNGGGNVAGANVTNVQITCVTPDYIWSSSAIGSSWINACASAGESTVLVTCDDSTCKGASTNIYDMGVPACISSCVGAPFALPFTFPIFGVPQTQFDPGADGWVQFGSETNANVFSPTAIPSQNDPHPALYPYYVDLYTRATGVCFVSVGIAPNRKFVVETNDAYVYGDITNTHLTFEVILNEDRSFDFLYQTMSSGASPVTEVNGANAVVGVEDNSGTLVSAFEQFTGGTIYSGQKIHAQPTP